MKRAFYILMLTILSLSAMAGEDPKPAKADEKGTLKIHFKNVVDAVALQLNDTTHRYKNANGDVYTITTFKYYISNISLIGSNGKEVAVPDTYLLVNQADPASLDQELTGIPAGRYNGIHFMIGVDSLRNFSGAQTGSLDPAKGMFWTWNSGYIFVKMEGESPSSTAKKNKLFFHIGGLKNGNNTLRTFQQKFTEQLVVPVHGSAAIEIQANAAALFKGKANVDFAKLNFTMGGQNSVLVADNYRDSLFSIRNTKD